ncbi:hypothetical protein CAPTEDRAFT_5701 [Capitella teleta]|uniref:Anaphase-promoting complex subunit 4 WD40 domain-containing protein n=1 Tax=Capitella teleta TaxID=283909 RepID=R7UIX0_CAPTE|nr:hypothetical protein CAPTEDRAFT_5701 [Capitella teleta]|eukprot:ELU06120.1 hypothetical protein CAPTEDRAFT_5701 [Capitella teleta]
MNFSELFKHTNELCKFSPDGKYLASAVQYRLIIRDVKTLQILQLYTCLDAIQDVQWAPDSEFVMCCMLKRGLVQIWSLEQPEWTCKVDEGSAGLIDARWSPDSRHVLTTADFHLRVTVWSLLDKSVSYIKYPKACQKGMDFSREGKYLALAERRDCKDCVSIFLCSTWRLVKHFETDTDDLAGVEWSPDSRVLCLWESSLQYRILLYSLDGRCLSSFSAYDLALGIKTVAWSPSSQFVAIGSYDQKVRLLNHVTWKTIVEHDHPALINAAPTTVVYREVTQRSSVLQEGQSATPVASKCWCPYDVTEADVEVACVKPDLNKANPRVGIGALAFSANSRYFYTRNDNMPNALWVWDVQKLAQRVVLLQESPITNVEWDPCQSRLALCTGNNRVYMWSPAGCLSVQVPSEASFTVQSVRWHPDGQVLLLVGKQQMCVCFLESESNNTL